jgi:alanine-alpha-ketoisovalerate/valine-pyruvate aminotransferase
VCGLVLIMIACAVVLAVPNRYALWRVDFLVPVASAALVGALVASRQPRNPVGWFVLGHALCISLGEFGRQYAIYGVLTQHGSLPFARVMIWPTYWVWYPGLVLMISLLPLYFPDGRLIARG